MESDVLTAGARRVLVVEDDAMQSRLVTRHLTTAGFEVRSVAEPVDALGEAVSWLPDAMVSDVLMPSLDGFELCRTLRRHPALATMPIILYSSVSSTDEAAGVARRAGATGFVARTADFRPLIDLLVRTLADGPTRQAATPAAIDAARSRLFATELRRQVHGANVLAGITRELTQSLDAATVATRIVDCAMTLLDGAASILWELAPDGALRPLATHGVWPDPDAPGQAVARVALEHGGAVWIADARGGGMLGAPLCAQGRILGVVGVAMPRGCRGVPAATTLAERFADQAAIALENARLHGAAILRSEERTALLSASRSVMAGVDLDVTLQRIIDEAAGIARTPYVKIMLLDAARGVLRVAAERSAQVPVGFELPVDGSYSGRVVTTRTAVFVADTQADPANPMRDRDRAEGVVTYLGLPVCVASEVLGVLIFNTRAPYHYGTDEIEYLSAFADQAAIAIRNAALFRREHEARADAERSRESLRLSETRYRAIIEHSIQGMLIHRDDRILFVNRAGARLVGCERPEDLIGQSAIGLVAPEDRERLAQFARARLGGQPLASQYELRAVRRDGPTVWLECLVSDIDWDGERAVLVSLIDISERKRSEEALRQTEEQVRQLQKMEAIGRLAGGMAHDFNNLLTVIIGRAEIIGLDAPAGSVTARGIESIRSTARRASKLTRQLLAFSRKQVLEPRVVDLGEVVAGIEPMLRGLLGEDIEITRSVVGDVGRVLVDPAQAEQVVMNLAVNARDAMPRGGRLRLDVRDVELDEIAVAPSVDARPGRYVLLQVSDTGCGMDAVTRAHIFEPFFTTKAVGQGTGLGLSTVFGVVKQSGGHIEVDSEPGCGSTFKIYFPHVDAQPAALAPEIGTPALAGGSETVLVVEDEQIIRDLIVEVLQSAGYRALAAGSGREALAMAQAHDGPIDLLLTDVIMPQLSGRDVAEQLIGLRPGARVLYVSGYTDDMISHHGLLADRARLLTKPFAPRTLLDRVREALDATATLVPPSPEPAASAA